jgi:ATP-dependent RNA helicase DHX8/PRP22
MSDIHKLEVLSLISRINQEVINHTGKLTRPPSRANADRSPGITDSTIAEFLIALHLKSKTLPVFKQNVKEAGAEFADSFLENIDRLILSLHPKYKKKSKKANVKDKDSAISDKEKKQRMFPGLALPDQEWKPPPQADGEKDAVTKEVDGLMSQLEGFAKKTRPRAGDFMDTDEPSPKRRRLESPPSRRRSPSPPRGRGYGYNDSRDDSRGRDDRGPGGSYRDNRGSGRGRELDERPVVYKIYDGRVSSIRDFGAFVQLEGVKGRVEGMRLCALSR